MLQYGLEMVNLFKLQKNVRINSVYADDPLYDKYHMEKYMESRRIIGYETSGVKKL